MMSVTPSRIQRLDADFLQDFFSGRAPEKRAIEEVKEIIEEQAPEIEKSFSEQELEEAKTLAHQAGFQQGYDEGTAKGQGEKAAQDQAVLQALQLASSKLESFKALYNTSLQATTAHANLLALNIVKKFLSTSLSEQAEQTIQQFITEHIADVMHQPAINISLHPDLKEAFEQRFTPAIEQAGYKGDIHMIANSSLGLNDTVLAWDFGKIEQNMSKALARIDQLVQDFAAHTTQIAQPAQPEAAPQQSADQTPPAQEITTPKPEEINPNNIVANEGANNVGD